jgi:uncharacterized protein YjiK
MRIRLTLVAASFAIVSSSAIAQTSLNLSSYVLQGQYALPVIGTPGVTAPLGSELATEASGVTWNRNTNTLFVMGDEGTSIVQTTLTGQYINSMTLPSSGSGSGSTPFSDTEGLSYLGRTANGQDRFVLTDERLREAIAFTYTPGTTLSLASTQRVKLGTTIGNTGLEGLSLDPLSSMNGQPGFVFVNQANGNGGSLQNIFTTSIDFAAGTATNGSPTTVNHASLFNPALTGFASFADVYALSNVAGFTEQPLANNILVLSYVGGNAGPQLREFDRAGNLKGSLTIPGGMNPQAEGLTMDDAGRIYIVSELDTFGGGSSQLFVYAPIPEPATLAMALAGIGLIARAKRRSKA